MSLCPFWVFTLFEMCLYLPVDSSDDGGAQTHAWDKADVKVLLENEWLYTGTYEEQSGVEVSLPGWGIGVIDEADQQPGRDQVKKLLPLFLHLTVMESTNCCSVACQNHFRHCLGLLHTSSLQRSHHYFLCATSTNTVTKGVFRYVGRHDMSSLPLQGAAKLWILVARSVKACMKVSNLSFQDKVLNKLPSLLLQHFSKEDRIKIFWCRKILWIWRNVSVCCVMFPLSGPCATLDRFVEK